MPQHHRFAFLMALIVACGPFALDAYLPGIPYMAHDLGVSTAQIATTVSIFVLGLAFGQLVGGPMSDHYGRKFMIMLGLLLFLGTSAIISQTNSLVVVEISRFIQAIGGGFAFVCIPALIRDRASGTEAAKLFSLIGLIMVAAPAIAPSLGALFIAIGSWHTIFYFLVIYPAIVSILVWRFVPFDKPQQRPSESTFKRYQQVLKVPGAHRYLIAQALIYSILIIFVANGSFIYQQYFGVSNHTFAILFAANIVMLTIANRVNSRRLNHFHPKTLLSQSAVVQLFAVAMLSIALYFGASLYAVVPCIVLVIGMHGGILPNSNAVYMSYFHHNTGSASALMGASNFICGAFFSALSTWLNNGTLWPVALLMLALSVTANLLLLGDKEPQQHPHRS
ncbi:multidrug effflux MFS transporter [Celerinatantimonas yamalensis]|uniref:Bcr/CflA family efflux transporter n=1 Tax=Celerinatantimonas yamalensis TaxID=559956 RepID=A0ABW9G8N9_9GAMM